MACEDCLSGPHFGRTKIRHPIQENKQTKSTTLNFSSRERICTSRKNSFFLLSFVALSVLANTYVKNKTVSTRWSRGDLMTQMPASEPGGLTGAGS